MPSCTRAHEWAAPAATLVGAGLTGTRNGLDATMFTPSARHDPVDVGHTVNVTRPFGPVVPESFDVHDIAVHEEIEFE